MEWLYLLQDKRKKWIQSILPRPLPRLCKKTSVTMEIVGSHDTMLTPNFINDFKMEHKMKEAKKTKDKKIDPKKLVVKHVIDYKGKNVKKGK